MGSHSTLAAGTGGVEIRLYQEGENQISFRPSAGWAEVSCLDPTHLSPGSVTACTGSAAPKGPQWLLPTTGTPRTLKGAGLAGGAGGASGQHWAGTGPGRKHTQGAVHTLPAAPGPKLEMSPGAPQNRVKVRGGNDSLPGAPLDRPWWGGTVPRLERPRTMVG